MWDLFGQMTIGKLTKRLAYLRQVLQAIQVAAETKNSSLIKKNVAITIKQALEFDEKMAKND